MNITYHRSLLFLLVMIGSIGLVACSESEKIGNSGGKFASGNKKSEKAKTESSSDGADALGNLILGDDADGSRTEKIVTVKTTNQSTADILWVLDNSGSMDEEINQVSINMLNFFNKIKDAANAKVGVISALSDSEKNSLNIDDNLKAKISAYDKKVSSNDAFDRTLEYVNGAGSSFLEPIQFRSLFSSLTIMHPLALKILNLV